MCLSGGHRCGTHEPFDLGRSQRAQPAEPAESFSVSIRAEAIILRSPTMTRRSSPKRVRITSTISLNALGSAVLPGKTRIATGPVLVGEEPVLDLEQAAPPATATVSPTWTAARSAETRAV
jgi:hypothetical protein